MPWRNCRSERGLPNISRIWGHPQLFNNDGRGTEGAFVKYRHLEKAWGQACNIAIFKATWRHGT